MCVLTYFIPFRSLDLEDPEGQRRRPTANEGQHRPTTVTQADAGPLRYGSFVHVRNSH